jgi:hypothetical protein
MTLVPILLFLHDSEKQTHKNEYNLLGELKNHQKYLKISLVIAMPLVAALVDLFLKYSLATCSDNLASNKKLKKSN